MDVGTNLAEYCVLGSGGTGQGETGMQTAGPRQVFFSFYFFLEFYLPLPCPLVRTAEEVMHFLGQHITARDCTPLSHPPSPFHDASMLQTGISRGGPTISPRP